MIDARPFECRLPAVLHQLGVGTWTGSYTLTMRLMETRLQHSYAHTLILSLICIRITLELTVM